jgi:hypothetical protein
MTRRERAKTLVVVAWEPGRFWVHGEWVDLTASDRCYCADAVWRNATCKHILAAEFSLTETPGDPS